MKVNGIKGLKSNTKKFAGTLTIDIFSGNIRRYPLRLQLWTP